MTVEEEFAKWQRDLPLEITSDVLWRCAAYRLATFVADRSWLDITRLAADPRTVAVADQLARSLGSIGANYADAYSRRSDRDRCRFYEYALSSAREARDWSFKARHVIGETRTRELLELLTRIIQLLFVTIVRERPRDFRRRKESTHDHRRDSPT